MVINPFRLVLPFLTPIPCPRLPLSLSPIGKSSVVALLLVFIGALAGMDPPLNPLMMLWVNLIMDTMGALALGTEEPTMELLKRRPYRRDARLISWPMARNIFVQSMFQLILLLWLLFDINTLFSDVRKDNVCKEVGSVSVSRGGIAFFSCRITPSSREPLWKVDRERDAAVTPTLLVDCS